MSVQVYRGEEKLLNYTITDDDGNVLDLTDKNVYFIVRPELPQFTDTETFEVSATAKTANGTCEFLLTANQTDVTPKLYFYEIYVEFQGGEIYSAEVGRFFVRKRVKV